MTPFGPIWPSRDPSGGSDPGSDPGNDPFWVISWTPSGDVWRPDPQMEYYGLKSHTVIPGDLSESAQKGLPSGSNLWFYLLYTFARARDRD